ETALFTAQILDNDAGRLDVKGGLGGPQNLSQQDFYIGINDLFGDSKTGAPFDPVVFTIYDAWKNLTGGGQNQARAAVGRGAGTWSPARLSTSAACAASPPRRLSKILPSSTGAAPRATTRRTRATTRFRRRSTSAWPTRAGARRTCRSTRCATK